jgi:hypothetical protein
MQNNFLLELYYDKQLTNIAAAKGLAKFVDVPCGL